MSERLSRIRHFFVSRRLASLEKLLFASIVLTSIALLAENTIIKTRLVLKPGSPHNFFLTDDRDNGGASIAEWINYDAYEWRCTLRRQYSYPYCQFHVDLGGIDLRKYETMKITLEYWSDAQTPNDSIRFSLQNNSLMYSTQKPNEMEVPAHYLLNGSFVSLMTDLKVPDWWLREHHIPPQYTRAEYDNVAFLQILTGSGSLDGEYRFKLRSIEWEGNLIPPEKWYFGIIIVWLAFLFGVLAYRVWYLKSEIDEHYAREQDLQRLNRMLDIKSRHFEKMARTDPLTGVSNRAGVSPILVDEVRSHLRTGNALTLIMLDIDHFKSINDTHGHDYGDAVLIKVARTLVDALRSSDTVARWGGEEFLIVCPSTSFEHGQALAEKLRKRIKSLSSSTKSPLSASFGVGVLGDESIDDFIRRVDEALYKAKQNGRDRVEMSVPG